MALMKCPDCGSDVSTEAPACPKCGRPTAADPKKSKNIPTGCGLIIIVLATIWIVGTIVSGGGNSTGNDSHSGGGSNASITAPAEPRPIQSYTAEQLYAMFHANEIKANQTIGNAIVRFSGTIASIEQSDFSKTPELMIRATCFDPGDCEDPDSWNTFEADLKASEVSSAAQLKIGQGITLQCGEVSMPVDVAAKNCIIVKDNTGAAAHQ